MCWRIGVFCDVKAEFLSSIYINSRIRNIKRDSSTFEIITELDIKIELLLCDAVSLGTSEKSVIIKFCYHYLLGLTHVCFVP